MPNENSQKGSKIENSTITQKKKEEEIEGHISSDPQVNSVTILGTLLDEMTKYSREVIPREAIGLLGGK
ncbi:MAG: hypothetical protein ACFFFH_21355, partial [Candidatus Thorarchaeota archaeon]